VARAERPVASPTEVALVEDAIKCVRLRRAGFSIAEIADALDLSKQVVTRLINTALAELQQIGPEEAENLRRMENERLDALMKAVWNRAEGGSLPHIHTALRLMERRSKLLALDLKPEADAGGREVIVIPAWAQRKAETIELPPGEQESDGGSPVGEDQT
jgi:DNA-binding transcriptional MerR regulator